MGRWLRMLLGPLPATLLLLPLLFAGGLGAALALIAGLVEPGRSAAERCAGLTTASLTLALWVAVLADPPCYLATGAAPLVARRGTGDRDSGGRVVARDHGHG